MEGFDDSSGPETLLFNHLCDGTDQPILNVHEVISLRRSGALEPSRESGCSRSIACGRIVPNPFDHLPQRDRY